MNGAPLLYVCVTCVRNGSTPLERRRGRDFAETAKSYAKKRGLLQPIRSVECLMGCPTPCNATLRSPGKVMFRFSGLDRDDAPDVIEISARYAENESGELLQEQLPLRLRGKLAARVMPLRFEAR